MYLLADGEVSGLQVHNIGFDELQPGGHALQSGDHAPLPCERVVMRHGHEAMR